MFSIVTLSKKLYAFASNLFGDSDSHKRSVTAQLTHLDGEPMRFQEIQLWDNDLFKDDFLGSAHTDETGKFLVNFSSNTILDADLPDIYMTVVKQGDWVEKIPFYRTPVSKNTQIDPLNLGHIVIPYWEYIPNFTVPLIYSSPFTPPPEDFAAPLATQMALVSAPLLATYEVHRGVIRTLGEAQLSAAEVQQSFPKNATIEMEARQVGSSRSDEYLVEATLNGFAPAIFSVDANGYYHVRYTWDRYHFDGVHEMPNVHAQFVRLSDGRLALDLIDYQFRKPGVTDPVIDGNGLASKKSVTSADGALWEQAKHYFRSAQFLYGEVSEHLGKGHVNIGQYAIAFNRSIHKSPIRKLLLPHLKGVTPINDLGKSIIFGSGSVLYENSPLTDSSIGLALRDALGETDWINWSPRAPVNEQHRYAHIQALFWTILQAYVADYFAKNGLWIRKYWHEIYYFSDTLVRHSADVFQAALPEGEHWYDISENSQKQLGEKIISSITSVKADPIEEDIQKLQQLCCYIIYHATIWHSWRNDLQSHFAGEAAYATLSTNPKPIENSFQIFIVNALVNTQYGYILKNEERDISTVLIRMLKDKQTDFQSYDYDIKAIRSKINI